MNSRADAGSGTILQVIVSVRVRAGALLLAVFVTYRLRLRSVELVVQNAGGVTARALSAWGRIVFVFRVFNVLRIAPLAVFIVFPGTVSDDLEVGLQSPTVLRGNR